MFKTLFINKTTQVVTETKVKILHGQDNKENPELNVYVDLVLPPNGEFERKTNDSKDTWARFSEVVYREAGPGGEIYLELKDRPNWKDPTESEKYVTEFINQTPQEWTYYSKYSGNFSIYPWFRKRVALSPLNPFAKFKEVILRFTVKVNQKTGRLRAREIEAVGNKLRSAKELEQLEADKAEVLKKYNLIEMNFNSEKGLT